MKRKYTWQSVVIFLLYALAIVLSMPSWLGLICVLLLVYWSHSILVGVFVVVWILRRLIQAVCLELIGKIMLK
jgi:hypothetical protein